MIKSESCKKFAERFYVNESQTQGSLPERVDQIKLSHIISFKELLGSLIRNLNRVRKSTQKDRSLREWILTNPRK